MKKRAAGIVFIVIFLIMITIPTLLVNVQPGFLSVVENRYLNDFPPAETIKNEGFVQYREAFVAALQDRIGLRSSFVFVADAVQLYVFGKSPSEAIWKGKDGWYFYAGENDVNIGMGVYKFDQEYLDVFAENQSSISDYYAAQGIDYFFIPSPSKTGIYPEYLPGEIPVQETVIDQITESLKNTTNVNVVELKSYMIGKKDEGQLYFKQDSHWTTLGSYFAYTRILDEMNKTGVLNGAEPVSAVVRSSNYGPGEFGNYYGGVFPDEYAPDVVWEGSAKKLESGETFERVAASISDVSSLRETLSIYENPDGEGGTLLIYGDSQMDSRLKVPAYLAEHFKLVVTVGRSPDLYKPLEDAVDPDVVILQRSERFLYYLYSVPTASDEASGETLPASDDVEETLPPPGLKDN